MKCPFTFSDPCCDRDEECRSDCALRVKTTTYLSDGKIHGRACALAVIASNCSIVDVDCKIDDTHFENYMEDKCN